MNYFFDKVFPPVVGTFLGACLAFAVKWLQDRREEKKVRVAAANYSLFVLVQQLNDLVQTEVTMPPWLPDTEQRTRWLDMKTIVGFNEILPLRTEDLGWLLQTKYRNLLGRYMSARNGYLTVQGLITVRHEIKEELNGHLETESVKAGLSHLEEFLPPEFLAAHISTRQRIRLTDITEGLILHNGLALQEHYQLLSQMHGAFKEIYPDEIMIKLDLVNDPLKQFGLSLREVNPQDQTGSQPRVHRIEVN